MANIKETIYKSKVFYQEHYGWYWVSIIGSLVMLVLSLISFLYTRTSFYTSLIVFYAVIIVIRTINFLIRKHDGFNDDKACGVVNPLLTGLIMVVFQGIFIAVLLIIINNKPLIAFPFNWLIYGYAAYAFFKMGSSIKRLVTGLKKKNTCELSLAAISLSSGLFTMLSLAVNLIGTFGSSDSESVAKLGEIWMVAVSGAINLLFAIYLIICGFKRWKLMKMKKTEEVK